jgi:membrane protease YdiL (CAAX protease family)
MKSLKQFAARHPYLFMLVIYPVIPFLLFLLQLAIANLFGNHAAEMGSFQNSTKVLAVLLYVLILWRFGWLRPAGFRSFGTWQAWLIMTAASIFEIALIIRVINGHFEWVNLLTLADPPAYLLVGLFEEIAFRGLILYTCVYFWGDTRRGLLKSILISSAIFGAAHMATLMTGNTLSGAILQSASSMISGILWAGLVLYGQSIWPAVVGHFLVDAIGNGALTYVPDFTRANWLIFWIEIPLLLLGYYLLSQSPDWSVIPEMA